MSLCSWGTGQGQCDRGCVTEQGLCSARSTVTSRRTDPGVPVGCQLEDGVRPAVPAGAWLSPVGRELAGDSTAGTGAGRHEGHCWPQVQPRRGSSRGGGTGRWADEAVLNPCLFLIHFSPSALFLFGAFFTLNQLCLGFSVGSCCQPGFESLCMEMKGSGSSLCQDTCLEETAPCQPSLPGLSQEQSCCLLARLGQI